jgi:hypothetical protein
MLAELGEMDPHIQWSVMENKAKSRSQKALLISW